MSKNEIINKLITELNTLKDDDDFEIVNVLIEPEIESFEWFDGTGYEYLSYSYVIKYKKPRKYKIQCGIKEYILGDKE